uniref:Uncharacterized protein n=1 Tax=Anguilla anguilla TaxID=7936 RepID=A0A0E9T4B9_ANGAN
MQIKQLGVKSFILLFHWEALAQVNISHISNELFFYYLKNKFGTQYGAKDIHFPPQFGMLPLVQII